MGFEGRSSLVTVMQRLGLMLAGFALCFFVYAYVAHEQPAYSWDYGSYAKLLVRFVGLFAAPGHSFSDNFAWSVDHDDYNPTSVVALMPVVWLFGQSRTVFIMSIVGLYLVPAAFVTNAVAQATRPTTMRDSPSVGLAISICAFLSWPFWITAMRGWPDVVGLVPLGLATIVVLRTNYLANATVRAAVFVGLMVWLAFLLRRTYAFACLSLLLLAFAFCIADILRRGAEVKTRLTAAVVAFAITGASALAGLLAFQPSLAWHVLETSYADEYSMYQASFGTTLRFVFSIFGPVVSALALLGLVRALVEKIGAIVFTTLACVLSFFFITQIQMPGEQHLLPFYFWLFPAFSLGVRTLFEGASAWRRAGVWIVPVLMLTSCLATFVPPASKALRSVAAVLPSYKAFPLKIDHYAGYQALIARLDEMLAPGTKVVVLASTEDLTSSYLEAMDQKLAPHLVPISDVDARDGLDFGPLGADIAVVSDPPALMNAPFQRIVEVPDRMIINGRDYGSAFTKVAGPFLLGHGQRAFIYRRSRPISKQDEAALSMAIRKYYPPGKKPNGTLF